MKGQGFARRVTPENLEQFAPLLRQTVAREPAAPPQPRDDAANEGDDTADHPLRDALALFQGEPITVRRPQAPAPAPEPEPQPAPAAPLRLADLLQGERQLLWEKELARSDVGAQQGNPTGGVRLTKAGFRVAGKLIDQTTYFRNGLFGRLPWTIGRQHPYREDATAEFAVSMRDQDLGVHRLKITHKPSGEAGQNNYTTILHWGDLGPIIRPMSLAGSTLLLFGSDTPEGPFSIVVR